VLATYRAFADGYQGYVPVTASYTGNGNFTGTNPIPLGYFRTHQRLTDTDFSLLNRAGDNETDLARSMEPSLFNLGPQKSPNEFTPQQFEQFKSCLSNMYKVYYQGHKFESGGEASFQGHSDSRRHFFSPTAIGDFTVRTDQQSYSTSQLHVKRYGVLGDLGGGHVIYGFTDSSSPYVNANRLRCSAAGFGGPRFVGS